MSCISRPSGSRLPVSVGTNTSHGYLDLKESTDVATVADKPEVLLKRPEMFLPKEKTSSSGTFVWKKTKTCMRQSHGETHQKLVQNKTSLFQSVKSSCSNYTASHKSSSRRHPSYRGVRQRKSGKWVSEVRDPTKKTRIWLGTFQNPEMAAVVHDVAALALHGVAATLNFPGFSQRLPPPASSSHHDIRRAALKAAKNYASASFLDPTNVEDEFVDEEAIFNMPLLVDSMAEGMLLTPPAMKRGFNWSQGADDEIDFTLWSWRD